MTTNLPSFENLGGRNGVMLLPITKSITPKQHPHKFHPILLLNRSPAGTPNVPHRVTQLIALRFHDRHKKVILHKVRV